ncbi:DUF427 domain-containing protein [Salinarimonas ramus]|uniref:DUF427 domain-containing protein n=1 Tax=Salinarimonas ramus TaxID=690164 RepID=A0A917V2F6_9HYPH|nr:DUF427 domain-containing protein [Salinarimonas ramus]GGK27792.1 hypothetical protein GCM10011322_12920 [Salinarimonas ramus]
MTTLTDLVSRSAVRRPEPVPPGPGQESVWDYPRPAVCEPTSATLEVVLGGRTIARTTRGFRVLETSHPPSYYFPPEDVDARALVPVQGGSMCEWKGQAAYFDVVSGTVRAARGAWAYPRPTPAFRPMAGYVTFYPGQMEACFVDGERVVAQEGGFYGGWITSKVVGPFKGGPGTRFW